MTQTHLVPTDQPLLGASETTTWNTVLGSTRKMLQKECHQRRTGVVQVANDRVNWKACCVLLGFP
jgi:hypothetical protein